MDKVEDNQYVAQLKGVFDTCDTTGTGYLDKEELTELCHKLHLDAQLPLLLETLLGKEHYARVDFEEFKEGFVAVLSSNVDLCISEDETSYLDPAVPEEIGPKYIKGNKRYGRRSRPESQDCEADSGRDIEMYQAQSSKKGQLRRSASLESLESLKSDEEPESNRELQNEIFEAQGQLRAWNPSMFESPRRASSPYSEVTENQVQAIWEEIGVGNNGFLNRQELAAVCQNIGLDDLKTEELDDLFKNLDRDKDGRVSFKEFQHGLFSHGPTSLSSCSTPFKQKKASVHQAFDESRATTPSLLSSTVGLRLFSCLNNGTGYASPEQIVSIWREEGIDNGREILEALDFNMEEKVELAELSIALDNEFMVNNNRVHQAAFASYRNEVQYLHTRVEQVSKERDKMKTDLEKAVKRNFQLVREVDDHHSVVEQLNESKIKDLEQEYREKLTAIKAEMDLERESAVQQTNKQRTELQAELEFLQAEEAELRERLSLLIKENHRLQNELLEVAEKLAHSEGIVSKLQKDLEFMIKDKFVLQDPQSTELFNQEERFAHIIKEFEQQCRELRDRNDELQNELEAKHAELQERKLRVNMPVESENRLGLSGTNGRSKHAFSDLGVSSMETDPTSISIEKELMVEKMKEYQQEIRDLKIQLETKVNFYERQIELMKRNFEEERKDIEQSFKLEISEVEEQRADLEEEVIKLESIIDELKKHGQNQEVDRRFEKERAEMEQYYAKEITSLAQRLTREKDQMEEDLKEKHQQELQVTRNWSSVLSEENCSLKVQLGRSEQKIQSLELEINQQMKELDDLKTYKEKVMCEMEDLSKQNEQFRDELSQLNFKNLQLISENSDLTAKIESSLDTIHKLSTQLTELARQKEESSVVAVQLQEALTKLERVQFHNQFEWEQEKKLLDEELQKYKEKVQTLNELDSEVAQLAYKNEGLMKELQDSKDKLLEASTSLALTHSQHAREVVQLKEHGSTMSKDQLNELQCRLSEEKQKVHKLQEQLNFQAAQANRQLTIQQEEYEQTVQKMEKEKEDLESNMNIVHAMLQEKVIQLKEQLTKTAKSDMMLKDLYVENAQLMKALQITEQRQKSAEKKNFLLEEKITALNRLLCRVAPAALAV